MIDSCFKAMKVKRGKFGTCLKAWILENHEEMCWALCVCIILLQVYGQTSNIMDSRSMDIDRIGNVLESLINQVP